MPSSHTTMAIVYDFDGTLARGNLQESQFLPDVGVAPAEFWDEVGELSREHKADNVLMYMYLMLEKARVAKQPVRRQDFLRHGNGIEFFKGVEDWFSRTNQYGKGEGIRVEHYIVSSGNTEIISGTTIASQFEEIYASKFMFNASEVAEWPALSVNYTTKTQYLFRINKGAHDLSDGKAINKFVPMGKRPIPFERMIYIGDGETDIPCVRLVKDLGGLSVAVYPPRTKGARSEAESLLSDGRVHKVVPADYRDGRKLDKVVKAHIRLVAAREEMRKAGSAP